MPTDDKGKIHLCLSKNVVDEYVRVLERMGLKDKQELEELLRLWAQGYNTLFIAKTPSLNIVQDDPDDNKFIECAVALKAQAIITGDKALLEVEDYIGIEILRPKAFLDFFAKHS